jgi:signal transduction histidine kinase
VLGTLCVIDKVPRHITDNQKNALQLLAKRAMRYLELRRTLNRQQQQIKEGSQQLQHLFNLAPGVFFRAEQRPNHPFILIFISKTVSKILPTLNIRELKSEPGAAYAFVVPEDLDSLKKDISQAGSQQVPFSSEFRINTPRQQEWCRLTAAPEVAADNKVIWHGSLQIITAKKQYVEILEQILFDISHTIRRPVATIQGLTHLIELNTITEPGLRDLAGHLKQVATEMDDHIRHLNSVYYTLQNRENSQ